MKKISSITAVLLTGFCVAAYAAHGGAGGGQTGAMSAQHMSGKGVSNTNGLNSADRDLGLDRAAERRNAAATSHENADLAQGKHKHSSKHSSSQR